MQRARKPVHIGFYSRREELINSITHGVGLLLSVAGMVWLLWRAAAMGERRHVVSFTVYGLTLLLLYLASTLYHGVRRPALKRRLRVLDHAAIYLLIAGTYTPFLVLSAPSGYGGPLLAIIWTMALAGVLYKAFFLHRFERASVGLYVMMGWLGVLGYRQLLGGLPLKASLWLLAGGIAYTAGVVVFALRRLPYNHAIWHVFVLSGSICHYTAIMVYLLPATLPAGVV